MDKGLLDFGILIEPFDRKKYDSLRLPVRERWGVLMRKDSPLADCDYITPDDLKDKPLLHSRQSKVQDGIQAWFGYDIEELNIVGTYNLLYNASLMVEEGVCYALCLDKLINTTGDSNLCFRPLINQVTAGIDLVWKKYQVFSKAADKFLEIMREQMIPHENGTLS